MHPGFWGAVEPWTECRLCAEDWLWPPMRLLGDWGLTMGWAKPGLDKWFSDAPAEWSAAEYYGWASSLRDTDVGRTTVGSGGLIQQRHASCWGPESDHSSGWPWKSAIWSVSRRSYPTISERPVWPLSLYPHPIPPSGPSPGLLSSHSRHHVGIAYGLSPAGLQAPQEGLHVGFIHRTQDTHSLCSVNKGWMNNIPISCKIPDLSLAAFFSWSQRLLSSVPHVCVTTQVKWRPLGRTES